MITNVAYSLKDSAIAFLEYTGKQTGRLLIVAQPAAIAKRCPTKQLVYGIIESSVAHIVDEI